MVVVQDKYESYEYDGHPTQALKIANDIRQMGHTLYVAKLGTGDYMREGGDIVVERKRSVSELAYNLSDIKTYEETNYEKFGSQLLSAKAHGQKVLIVMSRLKLFEECCTEGNWLAWHPWSDERCKWGTLARESGMTGEILVERLGRFKKEYGLDIVYADDDKMAQKIVEVLQ